MHKKLAFQKRSQSARKDPTPKRAIPREEDKVEEEELNDTDSPNSSLE